ncbi:hypothetical protein HYH07_21300 [Bradyrhizobium sp. BR 10261]|nr:hypothetical protein [Bradyrhizobium sp. BR 10261]
MKRGIAILISLCALAVVLYFTASGWAIRHETMTFLDVARDNRLVIVDTAVRRDSEIEANAGLTKLPVTIISSPIGRCGDYSWLANYFAARGSLSLCIQHDLPPLATKVGELYVGRLAQLQRGVINIKFVIEEMKKVQPNADYDHLTVVGRSTGGDISMYFARQYPDRVTKVVTLDNLRVPFVSSGRLKLLSFRAKDPQFKTDPGVMPDAETLENAGITIVPTGAQHTDFDDRSPDQAKERIEATLDRFLKERDTDQQSSIDVIEKQISDLAKNVARTESSKNASSAASPAASSPNVYWNAWFVGDTPPSGNVLTAGQFYTLNLDISAFRYSDLRSKNVTFPVSVRGDAGVVALLSESARSTILTIKPIISDASGLVIVEPKDAYGMSIDLDKLRQPDMKAVWKYETSKGPVAIPEELSAGKVSLKIRARSPGCASMSFAIFEDLRPLDHLVLRVVTKDQQGKLPPCASDAWNGAPLTGGLDALRDAALGMESRSTRVVGDAALYIFDADVSHSLVVFVDGRKGVRKSVYGWQTDGSIVDFLKTAGFEALVAKAEKDAAKNLDGAYVAVAQQLWSVLATASAPSGTAEEAQAGADAFRELVREAKAPPVVVVRVASSLGAGATRSLFVPFGILGARGNGAVLDKPITVVQPMAKERFVSNDRCISDWTLVLPQALESVPDDVMDVDHFPKPLPGTRIKDIAGFTAFLGNGAFALDRPASGLIVLAHQGEGALWFEANTNRIIKQNISHRFSPGSVGILSACSVAAMASRNAELLEKFNEQGLDTLIASPFTLDASYGVQFAYSFSEAVQEAVAAGRRPTIVELFKRAIEKTGERFSESNIGNYRELGLEYVVLGNPAIKLCASAEQPSAQ